MALSCGEKSYNPRTQYCCDNGEVVEKVKCGYKTINPCYNGCCGERSYSKRTGKCCHGKLTPKSKTCSPSDDSYLYWSVHELVVVKSVQSSRMNLENSLSRNYNKTNDWTWNVCVLFWPTGFCLCCRPHGAFWKTTKQLFMQNKIKNYRELKNALRIVSRTLIQKGVCIMLMIYPRR